MTEVSDATCEPTKKVEKTCKSMFNVLLFCQIASMTLKCCLNANIFLSKCKLIFKILVIDSTPSYNHKFYIDASFFFSIVRVERFLSVSILKISLS